MDGQVGSTQICFAFCNQNRRNPSALVTLSPIQIIARASVCTGSISNPYKELQSHCEVAIYLCVPCRDISYGWQVIDNPRRYGATVSQRALHSWHKRCTRGNTTHYKHDCFLCSVTQEITTFNKETVGSRATKLRNPTRDWTLFNISVSKAHVQDKFCKEIIRLSRAHVKSVERLLSDPFQYFLCYYHLNHSRMAQKVAKDRNDFKNAVRRCRFTLRGCCLKGSSVRTARLWVVKEIEVDDLNHFEAYSEFEERIRAHSDGEVGCQDVMNQTCFRGFYI